jgi:hypothetical protein
MNVKHLIALLVIISVTTMYFSSTLLMLDEKDRTFPLSYQHPAIRKGIDFLKTKVDEDGCIRSVSVTAWAAIAVASSGDNLSKWNKIKQYLIDAVDLLNESLATDWERHCLALVAFGVNPRNVSGVDFVERIKEFYDHGQIGFENNDYDDCFGILALRSCDVPKNDEIISSSMNFIKGEQRRDGGWGDVDTTAAAILALTAYNSTDTTLRIQNAIDFIKSKQTEEGGFFSWGCTNTASTSWVLCSLSSLCENPFSDTWKKNNHSPVDFLLDLQQADGSFLYSENSAMNPEWMTAYALIALTGGTFVTYP